MNHGTDAVNLENVVNAAHQMNVLLKKCQN